MRKVIVILNEETLQLETFGSVAAAIEKCTFDNMPSRATFDKYFSRLKQDFFIFNILRIYKTTLITA